MIKRYLLGLPLTSVNILSIGIAFMFACFGVRLARSPNVALETASMQLNISNGAKTLLEVSQKLEEQAEIIQDKDEAYEELLNVYRQSLRGRQEPKKIQRAIETIEKLPEVENIEEVKQKVEEIEQGINLITTE